MAASQVMVKLIIHITGRRYGRNNPLWFEVSILINKIRCSSMLTCSNGSASELWCCVNCLTSGIQLQKNYSLYQYDCHHQQGRFCRYCKEIHPTEKTASTDTFYQADKASYPHTGEGHKCWSPADWLTSPISIIHNLLSGLFWWVCYSAHSVWYPRRSEERKEIFVWRKAVIRIPKHELAVNQIIN